MSKKKVKAKCILDEIGPRAPYRFIPQSFYSILEEQEAKTASNSSLNINGLGFTKMSMTKECNMSLSAGQIRAGRYKPKTTATNKPLYLYADLPSYQ